MSTRQPASGPDGGPAGGVGPDGGTGPADWIGRHSGTGRRSGTGPADWIGRDSGTGPAEGSGPDEYESGGPVLRRVGGRVVYENPWMRVREDDVLLPDGTASVFGVVEKRDFVVVLPRGAGGFWMVRQHRYPLGRDGGWEFPAGATPPHLPEAEDSESVARAELAEETGLRAERMVRLGRLAVAHGYSSTHFDVFLATGLEEGEPDREPTEADMVHRLVPDAELSAMIRSGRITDGPSLAALLLYDRCAGDACR